MAKYSSLVTFNYLVIVSNQTFHWTQIPSPSNYLAVGRNIDDYSENNAQRKFLNVFYKIENEILLMLLIYNECCSTYNF